MSHRPIHIDPSPRELFGEGYRKCTDAEIEPTDGAGLHDANDGRQQDSYYDGTNLAILGDSLLCAKDEDTYGRCTPIPIDGPKAMIVVHPSTDFDENAESAPGARAAVARARGEGIPVVYLVQAYDSFEDMFLSDLAPTHYVRSHDGIHTIDFEGDRLIMAGGYLQNCFRTALREVLKRRKTCDPLTIEVPTDAVYMRWPVEYMSTTIENVLSAEEDKLQYLVELIRELYSPLASDIDTGSHAINESYRFTVCLDDECMTSSTGAASDPLVRVLFRSQR